MTDDTTLTETEISQVRASLNYMRRNPGAKDDLLVTVESIVAARVAEARADEHAEWLSRVGALRAKHLRNVRLNINGRADIYDGFLFDLRTLIAGDDQ